MNQQGVHMLIIGAGPFGLSLSAYARHLGLEHQLVGQPMDFWKTHMPQGMYLRSGRDWHLDPLNVHTIEKFLQTRGLTPSDVEPLSLRLYLDYVEWFQEQKQIETIPLCVQRLDRCRDGKNRFRATMSDGQTIAARCVVLAPGFKYFKYLPPDLVARLPRGRYSHTCDRVEFDDLKGKRCLIIGGRQSAFEWAALASEAGASAVHLSHRHNSPAFAESDWTWVTPLVEAMDEHPGWYRALSKSDKEALNQRFWEEGRLKVEPWLEARVRKDTVKLWPGTQVMTCRESANGELEVALDNGTVLTVDHLILATGYKVNMNQVPFLAEGNCLDALATSNGYPVLDEQFRTTIPGLFITSMPATQDFGPFFAFTVSVRASARIIGHAIQHDSFPQSDGSKAVNS